MFFTKNKHCKLPNYSEHNLSGLGLKLITVSVPLEVHAHV